MICLRLSLRHRPPLLTPDFGTKQNTIKKASNGKVLKVRKFCVVERRNFEVWAIAIRSHLESRNCVQNTGILYTEHYSADYAFKMISYEKYFYMNCLCLVESVDFHIKIVSNRVRMQKLELFECSPIKRRNMARPIRHMSDGCLMRSVSN